MGCIPCTNTYILMHAKHTKVSDPLGLLGGAYQHHGHMY